MQRIGCYVTPCRSNHNYETRVETVEAEYRERREVQDSSLRYMYLRIGFILGQQEVLIRRTSISLLKGWVTSNPILEGGRSWFLITKYIEEGEELFCISSKHSNYAWTYSKVVIPWLWEDLLHDTSLASLLGLEKRAHDAISDWKWQFHYSKILFPFFLTDSFYKNTALKTTIMRPKIFSAWGYWVIFFL